MKYGVSLKINVKQIDKARLFQGKEAVYLDATIFLDTDNVGKYGDHGMITQDVSKEERAQGTKGNILGNAKIFYTAESGQSQGGQGGYQGGQGGGYNPNGGNQGGYKPPAQNNQGNQGGYQPPSRGQTGQGNPADDQIPF